MTKKEVRAYLHIYCGVDLEEGDCTLENVLNLIPTDPQCQQIVAFAPNTPLREHQMEECETVNVLSGDLQIERNDCGYWLIDWSWYGIIGAIPQGKDLMTAALRMCEFCAANRIPLNLKRTYGTGGKKLEKGKLSFPEAIERYEKVRFDGWEKGAYASKVGEPNTPFIEYGLSEAADDCTDVAKALDIVEYYYDKRWEEYDED